MRRIDSRHNPLVTRFRALAESSYTDDRLLLDGAHLVREARASGVSLDVVAVSTSRLSGDTEEGRLARALASDGVDVVEASDQAFAALSPVRTPSGLAAIASRPLASATDLCARRDALLVVAVDVQDPGNLGAVLRVSEAAGATGVLACGGSANPFSWKAVRGSMGSVLRLPTVGGLSLAETLSQLESARVRPVAAIPRGGADPDAIDWRGNVAVLLGGEGGGLPDDVVAQCVDRVSVPMAPPVESLNVAAAAAVLVYAARRQRL